MERTEILNAALKYHDSRLTVIPVEFGGKRPLLKWREYTERPQTREDVQKFFSCAERNIGIVGGDCSDNFVALDFDSRTSYSRLLSNQSFQRIVNSTPVVRSGRGVHVYLKTPEPVQGTRVNELHLDVKGTGGYVVAPPSLHGSSGQHYLFEREFHNVYRLNALDEIGFLQLTKAEYRLPAWYGLGKMFRVLKGEFIGHASRSQAEAALVLVCIKNGWSFDEVFELFRKHADETTKYREKERQGHGFPYIKGTYENALQYYRTKRSEIDRFLDELAVLIDRYPFEGRTRWSDAAVSRAVLQVAKRAGKGQFDQIALSSREIAELSGVSFVTASKALKRVPFLTLASTSEGLSSSVYRITGIDAKSLQSISTQECEGMLILGTNRKVAHDAFRSSALGKPGFEIVLFLNEHVGERFTSKEISDLSGVPLRTAIRKITSLERSEILSVEKDGRNKWYRLKRRIDSDNLDEIARRHGTSGAGARQRAQHVADRKKSKERLQQNIAGWQELAG